MPGFCCQRDGLLMGKVVNQAVPGEAEVMDPEGAR